MKKDNKGFSLVELIIVIAIMAVLIGLLAPQYLRFVDKSKLSADVSNAQAIASAYNVAFADGKVIANSTYTGNGGTTCTDSVGMGMWPEGKKADKAATWKVVTNVDGVSYITLGGTSIYPKPASPYDNVN